MCAHLTIGGTRSALEFYRHEEDAHKCDYHPAHPDLLKAHRLGRQDEAVVSEECRYGVVLFLDGRVSAVVDGTAVDAGGIPYLLDEWLTGGAGDRRRQGASSPPKW